MNLENILDNECRFKIIKYLEDLLKFNISHINNVDELTEDCLKDFKYLAEFEEFEDELVYANLMASKMIAQLAWNNYQNKVCFEECQINEKYLEKICSALDNKDSYENYFNKFKLGKECTENLLIEILSRYLIIFCILYYREIDYPIIKSCFYCDSEDFDNVCLVCGESKFVFKDDKCKTIRSDCPSKIDDLNNKFKFKSEVSSSSTEIQQLKSTNQNNSLIKFNYGDDLNAKLNSNNKNNVNTKSDNTKVKHVKYESNLQQPNDSIESNRENPVSKHNFTKFYDSDLNSKNVSILSSDSSINFVEINNELPIRFWKCSSCSYKNEESSQFCLICLDGKLTQFESNYFNKVNNLNKSVNLTEDKILIEKDKWICKECSFKNVENDMFCFLCYANNPNKNNFEIPDEEWNCTKCKMKNPFDRYKCEKCDEFADFFNKWVCEKCCFFNENLAKNCKICGILNSHLIKCGKCSKYLINKQYDNYCHSCTKTLENDDNDGFSTCSVKNNYSRRDFDTRCIKKLNMVSERKKNQNKFIQHHCWFCINEKCFANNLNKTIYCNKCFVKNEREVSNSSFFIILKNDREMKLCRSCNKIFESKCPNLCDQNMETAV